jgi:photosynthetic reaction center cytochrome c subunit
MRRFLKLATLCVSRPGVVRAAPSAAFVCFAAASLCAQAPASQKPVMADDVFKNIQVMKGLTVNEFMETMGFFSAALGYNCTNCHVEESLQNWAKFADDVPAKKRARGMILMVNSFNRSNFGGKRALTCYTCHRGSGIPKVTPSLAEQYGTPLDDPNEVEIFAQIPNAGTADQILDRYIEAAGGAASLAGITSFAGKGTYSGFDTSDVPAPMELFANSSGQRAMLVHGPLGDSATVYDGRSGWISGPDKPVPVLALASGADLDGLKLDANLAFPGGIKQTLRNWRAGFPATSIGDTDVDVVEGATATGARVKLYFDRKSGLLVRQVRFTDTVVGLVPTQIDYSDYREVAGVKMPFQWTTTWTDGQSTTELSEIRANVTIDPQKFGRPAEPSHPTSLTAH